jgi:hypothetical protein
MTLHRLKCRKSMVSVLNAGWASWLVKEIVAPGLPSKQTRLRELVAGGERCAAPVFVRQAPDDSQARELYPRLPQQLRGV